MQFTSKDIVDILARNNKFKTGVHQYFKQNMHNICGVYLS